MSGHILVVDDDPSILETVELVLSSAGYSSTTVDSGEKCLTALRNGFRGLILMDVMMPEMDGWDTIESIVEEGLLDGNVICMLTAINDPGPKLESLTESVLGYMRKPFTDQQLIATVEENLALGGTPETIVCVASSTGGPPVLRRLFDKLPRLDAAILVVQHMPKFILKTLQRTLNAVTEMTVVVAEEGVDIAPGHIYLAPSSVHLELVDNRQIHLSDADKVCLVRPSADVLMCSLKAETDRKFVGVQLTGMGRDGAAGIAHIKDIGGTTAAQNEKSSSIFSMPAAAIETGKVDHVRDPKGLHTFLLESTRALMQHV